MRHAFAAFAFGALVGASPVVAQDRGTVVELFTSQGCSSCPPADRILAQLADRDDVIALALHVDYWDYIGWADDLGNAAFTQRQRAYAQTWAARQVYTPQMVVAGVDEFVGSHPVVAMDRVAAHPAAADPVRVDLSRAGDTLTITAEVQGPVPPTALVQLVRYEPEVVRDIAKGENAGQTIVYRNVVTSWAEVGAWSTEQPLRLDVSAPGDQPAVVIVQDGASGPILGAVRLR
ncbi:hypothetical protein SAMN05444339_101979 [Loktanella atrilutea]|uniref:DUF1223 domain-containing protein n=1 Tax=Loktanella atrilutea TaxID=366533 RepID=A0A1M4V7L7_LOKAT|nr:DUF1223 domain-containing protein [Loktanella atrilutea]SHE64965.1 hypothetical protein SAMN05444339_101979 [Loktanella atrilutea]